MGKNIPCSCRPCPRYGEQIEPLPPTQFSTDPSRIQRRIARDSIREEILRLTIEQVPEFEIAQRFNVSVAKVRYELSRIKARKAASIDKEADVLRAMALARIDSLELMYRRGHEDSQKPVRRNRTLTKTKSVRKRPRGGDPVGPAEEQIEYEIIDDGGEESVEVMNSKPDPRWANGIAWCIAERNKILGNYAKETVAAAQTQVLVIVGEERIFVPPPLPPHIPENPPSITITDVQNMVPPNIVFEDEDATPFGDAAHTTYSGESAEPQASRNGQAEPAAKPPDIPI